MNDGRALLPADDGHHPLERSVGYDRLDSLPLATLPADVRAAAGPTLQEMTTAIAREGGVDPTLRSGGLIA